MEVEDWRRLEMETDDLRIANPWNSYSREAEYSYSSEKWDAAKNRRESEERYNSWGKRFDGAETAAIDTESREASAAAEAG